MEEIAISKFKATCVAVEKRARKTVRPLPVTWFGVAVTEVVAPRTEPKKKSGIESMKETAKIVGYVVSP